jgi:alanine racemase
MFPAKPQRYSASVQVFYSRLERNIQLLKAMMPSSEIIFMVKADAYGHGLLDIVHFSFYEMGIKNFGVATLGEAIFLRQHVLGEYEIFVFSELHLEDKNLREYYFIERITPVLSTQDHVSRALGCPDFKFVPFVLKLNTGMNRLGLSENDLPWLVNEMKRRGRSSIQHLMTHFSSDQNSPAALEFSRSQVQRFQEIKKNLMSHGISIESTSLSNSAAISHHISRDLKIEENFIRPGIMLYGPIEGDWKGSVISDLRVEVLHVFEGKKGDPIGYGPEKIEEEATIAILAIGYGDGLNRHLKGCEIATEWGKGRIIGRMNMDMTYLALPLKSKIKVGDNVLLWGSEMKDIQKLAGHLQTIPYEIFCHLGVRLPKQYKV